MQSSTGYGLTTSILAWVSQKRLQMMKCCGLFCFAIITGTFPTCLSGEDAPGRDAAAAAEHPCRLPGLHRRDCGLRSKPQGGRRLEEPGSRALCGWRRRRGGALWRESARGAREPRDQQRACGLRQQGAASGGGPSVSLDHFAVLGKMNHGGCAATPLRQLR